MKHALRALSLVMLVVAVAAAVLALTGTHERGATRSGWPHQTATSVPLSTTSTTHFESYSEWQARLAVEAAQAARAQEQAEADRVAADQAAAAEAARQAAQRPVVIPNAQPQIVISTPAPGPVSGASCAGTAVEGAIRAAFAGTGAEEWALSVAARESGCNPCAYYPSQSNCFAQPTTAKGLFELLGHDYLLAAACPGNPFAWANAACNASAARSLFDGSGTAPWRL